MFGGSIVRIDDDDEQRRRAQDERDSATHLLFRSS